jgi:hypothetical protein
MELELKEYMDEYKELDSSESINKLVNWKLKNHDKEFDSEEYSKNINSFLDDIESIINNMGSDKSEDIL